MQTALSMHPEQKQMPLALQEAAARCATRWGVFGVMHVQSDLQYTNPVG